LENSGRTLLTKIWDQHVIARISDDTDLLHVDRHLLHDLGGSRGLLDLKNRNLGVHSPELTFATPDHAISTARGRAGTIKIGQELLAALRVETSANGIAMFDIDEPGQGIVHVIGPELGLSLPGCLIVCGDSHTCTHGGVGALAFGIGSSELTHVLATQAIIQRRPKTMRVKFEGRLPFGVTAKDLILALIGHIGAAGGTGYAVEYAGSAIRDMPVEGRLTICNLSIELGAKMGLVAPDERTYDYIRGRAYAPHGEMWERAVAAWRQLPSDADAVFDREVVIDVEKIIPQVTWGISPEHVIGVDGLVPDPKEIADPARRAAIETALDYMGLKPGTPIIGTPVDWVFIGSCTNSRLSDLRAAAEVARGRKVAPGVRA
jgi:3-isopropylmalate/(R)-2-methylmalate dehydratase large subunit